MKKAIFTFIVFALIVNVSAQIKIDSSSGQVGVGTLNPQYRLHIAGDAYATGNMYLGSTSNFLGTTNNVPVTFKVNNTLAGFTGSSDDTNASFGYK